MKEAGTHAGQPNAEFYYTVDGNRIGPVTAQKIKELADSKTITPQTLIWKQGMEDWIPAGQVKSLFAGHTESALAMEADRAPASSSQDDIYGVAHGQPAPPTSQYRVPGTRRHKSIYLEGAFTPSIALLPEECILDEFEAGLWDLGIVGYVFRYKRRLVLTTHRLVHFDKKIVDNTLQIVWLRSVKMVVVGQTIGALQAIIGALLVLTCGPLLLVSVFGTVFGRFGAISGVLPGLVGLGMGVLAIVTARRKVMTVSTGEDKTGLTLIRIESDESKRFVDKIFASLEKMSP